MKKVRLISFDCYGTLIDWRKGVLDALRPVLDDYFISMNDEQLFSLFAESDEDLVTGEFRLYRDILREIMNRIARRLNINIQPSDIDILAESMPSWPPFHDTIAALQELKGKDYRLAILSNTDRNLMEQTLRHLNTEFDVVITSEELGSYKPSPANFMEALRRFHLPADQIVHVAQSRFHDIIPARDLGMNAVWINRYHDPVPPLDEEFSGLRFPDLGAFVTGLKDIEGC